MKPMVKKMAVVMTAAALTASLAACGNASNEGQKAGSTASSKPAKPTDISITTLAFAAAPTGELEAVKKLNEKLNVNLKLSWIPSAQISEKLNALLASRDLPDVLFIEDFNSTPAFLNAIDQGAFWELTDYVKNYPNLAKYPENVYKNASLKGKLYSLPRVRPLDGHESLLIRKDWLDKLGLQPPKTMDELYNVLEAFAKKDPDGNGTADTYGAVFPGSPGPSSYLLSLFGTGTKWKEENGGLTPYWWTPQAKEALINWNKVYKTGGILPDFPVLKTAQIKDMLVQGKAGLAIANVVDAYKYNVELQKTNPKANLVAFELPKAADGKAYYEQASGFYGQFLINKKSVDEDKLKKILEVYDYTASLEGYNLAVYGIQDVDYKLKPDGFVEQTEEGKKKGYSGDTTGQWVTGTFDKYLRAKVSGIPNDVFEANKKLVDSISSIPDPTYGLMNSTPFKEKGADWNKKLNDMLVNVIIGKNSIEDWDKFVKTYKDDPSFQQHVKETSDFFKEKNKK
ncbi:extracellular solute-binding protein [Paenibacillus sp. V4I5]|uniref:extracellular solute-binding protein n=1 Tax=Paenibacillus sp. V4I5 TaxID=3042306 RepID=UPI002794352F|nr:extracellular solute-binding protein [Paenibacillus sp. V4I5]MDQ0920935.1 putative aldouronate transport system substrate-binding protein [Paenibacillus sp. V4I5]